MEDVRDEDKVMLALWNRYIIMHRCVSCGRAAGFVDSYTRVRSDFTKNSYYDGVVKFVDKYWEMIHQAAGWRALRAFLIVSTSYVLMYLRFG